MSRWRLWLTRIAIVENSASTSTQSSSEPSRPPQNRSEEHTSELQSQSNLVCRLLLEKKKQHSNDTNASVPRDICRTFHICHYDCTSSTSIINAYKIM